MWRGLLLVPVLACLSCLDGCQRHGCGSDGVVHGSISAQNGDVFNGEVQLGRDTDPVLRGCTIVTGSVYVARALGSAHLFDDIREVRGGISFFMVTNDGSMPFFPNLRSTPSVNWEGGWSDAGGPSAPPVIDGFNELVETTSVDFNRLVTRRMHAFAALKRATFVRIDTFQRLEEFEELTNLEHVGTLQLSSTRTRFPHLVEVDQDLTLGSDDPVVDFPVLVRIGGNLWTNGTLGNTFNAPMLESVHDVVFDHGYGSIIVPRVTTVGGNFYLEGSELTSMAPFAALRSCPSTSVRRRQHCSCPCSSTRVIGKWCTRRLVTFSRARWACAAANGVPMLSSLLPIP